MTIAAGFRTSDGVLIWADTEYSGTGSKSHARKIFTAIGDVQPLASAIFSFAGDNTDLAIAAIQKCVRGIRDRSESLATHESVAALVESIISAEYKEHVSPSPKPEERSLYQVIFAAHGPNGGSALYSSWQCSIRQHDTYSCVGIGEYLGRALIDPIFNDAMDINQASIVAAYVARNVKEHVQNVSGQTNLMYLSDSGGISGVSWRLTRDLEDGLRFFDARVNRLLLDMLLDSDEKFRESVNMFGEDIKDLRLRLGLAEKSVKKLNLWPTLRSSK